MVEEHCVCTSEGSEHASPWGSRESCEEDHAGVPNRKIRVVIADDHEMMRGGLGVFLQAYDDLELVGVAVNGSEAVGLCARLQPDVLLVELGLQQPDSLDVIRAVQRLSLETRVIALANLGDERLGKVAIEAGAFCWMLKDVAIDVLASGIREAYRCADVQMGRGQWILKI